MISKEKTITYNGFTFAVYPISWLAFLMGRATITVRRWERTNMLPKPLFQLPNCTTRYYCAAEIQGYVEILKQSNIRRCVLISSTGFNRETHLFKERLRKVIDKELRRLPALPHQEKTRQYIKLHQQKGWQQKAMRLIK